MQVRIMEDIYTIDGNKVSYEVDSKTETTVMPYAPCSVQGFLEWGVREGWFTGADVLAAEEVAND